MRSLIILFVTCALVGCKSQKNVVASHSVKTDSLAHSEHHRTIAVIDSVVRNIDFSFDALKINIERPSAVCDKPEVIRLKAVRGRVIDRRRVHRDSVEAFNRLDTVAYHQFTCQREQCQACLSYAECSRECSKRISRRDFDRTHRHHAPL